MTEKLSVFLLYQLLVRTLQYQRVIKGKMLFFRIKYL